MKWMLRAKNRTQVDRSAQSNHVLELAYLSLGTRMQMYEDQLRTLAPGRPASHAVA